MTRHIRDILTLAGFLFAATLLSGCKGCAQEDDEAKIRALIEKGRTLSEEHDVKGVMDLATKDFTAVPQGMTRQEVSVTLLMAFRKYEDFTIHFPRPSVTVEPSKTEAQANITFIVVRRGEAVPDLGSLVDDPQTWLAKASKIADPYELKLWLVKEDGEWKANRAQLSGMRSLEDL